MLKKPTETNMTFKQDGFKRKRVECMEMMYCDHPIFHSDQHTSCYCTNCVWLWRDRRAHICLSLDIKSVCDSSKLFFWETESRTGPLSSFWVITSTLRKGLSRLCVKHWAYFLQISNIISQRDEVQTYDSSSRNMQSRTKGYIFWTNLTLKVHFIVWIEVFS